MEIVETAMGYTKNKQTIMYAASNAKGVTAPGKDPTLSVWRNELPDNFAPVKCSPIKAH